LAPDPWEPKPGGAPASTAAEDHRVEIEQGHRVGHCQSQRVTRATDDLNGPSVPAQGRGDKRLGRRRAPIQIDLTELSGAKGHTRLSRERRPGGEGFEASALAA
jgi:hypothetical protein